MNGLEIVRSVYTELKKPSDLALPYPVILNSLRKVLGKKKLDLALSEQNSLAVTSEWFTAQSADFILSDQNSNLGNVFLPINVEVRSAGADQQFGQSVPIVNFELLRDARGSVAAFYGSPLRMALNVQDEALAAREYRITYEPDFFNGVGLNQKVQLPEFFFGMVVDEALYEVIDLVENSSPEYAEFRKTLNTKLGLRVVDWRDKWDKFVYRFKGRATVPKRTMLDRRSCRGRLIMRREFE